MITIQAAIKKLISKTDLSTAEMQAVMTQIMTGKTEEAQIGGFLVGLATKGETVPEIIGATKVMRQLATPVKIKNTKHLVDTCGTGGDGATLFNVSTAAAFVAAAGGAQVAKHGNRSISSQSGSADLLELAGADLNLAPDKIAQNIEKIGIGFMFAPAHHSAMKHAIGTRKSLGVRTIFNILGPLTNPASTPNQVLGVYDKSLLMPVAQTLQALGSEHVMVLHSQDGLDEISIVAPTEVVELKDNSLSHETIYPADFGLAHHSLAGIKASSPQQSLQLIKDVLGGKKSAARDIVVLNAGAAIYVAGIKDNLEKAVQKAQILLDSGIALEKFENFIQMSTHSGN